MNQKTEKEINEDKSSDPEEVADDNVANGDQKDGANKKKKKKKRNKGENLEKNKIFHKLFAHCERHFQQ